MIKSYLRRRVLDPIRIAVHGSRFVRQPALPALRFSLVEFGGLVRPDTPTSETYEELLERCFTHYPATIADAASTLPLDAAARDTVVEQLEGIEPEQVLFAHKMQPRFWVKERFFNTHL
jgi:hypothetical protein